MQLEDLMNSNKKIKLMETYLEKINGLKQKEDADNNTLNSYERLINIYLKHERTDRQIILERLGREAEYSLEADETDLDLASLDEGLEEMEQRLRDFDVVLDEILYETFMNVEKLNARYKNE